MSEDLPIKTWFSIDPKYALLVGVTQMTYARFESAVVDIIGFHVKGFRSDFYCSVQFNPRDLKVKLSEIGKPSDRAKIELIQAAYQRAIYLRNALDHSVPYGGPDGYDALHPPRGVQKPNRKSNFPDGNPFRNTSFDYETLRREAQQMARSVKEAEDFFYELRARNHAGELFPGDPC